MVVSESGATWADPRVSRFDIHQEVTMSAGSLKANEIQQTNSPLTVTGPVGNFRLQFEGALRGHWNT